MMNAPSLDELFDQRVAFPDPDAQERLAQLVGLDAQIDSLSKMLGILVNPDGLRNWAKRKHRGAASAIELLVRRPPLVILAGDVGSGKTALAESIGDLVARREKVSVTLYPISLSTRGQGRVGEMTQLLSAAFSTVHDHASKLKNRGGKVQGAVILLVDEADALAQSREAAQMHHEDRAGVNAFIRGVDRLATGGLPTAVIMCTNRLSALDPAVRRRAAEVMTFTRPDASQRSAVLAPALSELGLSPSDIAAVVKATGAHNGRAVGCSFSDLTQRVLPSIVLDAYPDGAVTPARAVEVAKSVEPTPSFRESAT
ncbi:MAG: AAA family ATPase [Marinicaulis sp.]|nr:AAA family ATPase [Marinicaulis sp.]